MHKQDSTAASTPVTNHPELVEGRSSQTIQGRADSRLEHEIAGVGRNRRAAAEAAFRATVEQRLRNLESELGEVKTRLNGLLFFIAGTVIAQVLQRLLA